MRQNNLQGFDLDVPLGRFVVVTGLSGTGKSSLVFDTLHAEGQRRYVETFSAYTRQFLDLLNPPRVDAIENIRPSIAIEQTNTVKTSRSTVGTMTELTDYAKVWFSRVAECYDPTTGDKVEDDDPRTVWTKVATAHPGRAVAVAFKVARPDRLTWAEILAGLRGQGYARVLHEAPRTRAEKRGGTDPGDEPTGLRLSRIEDLAAAASPEAGLPPGAPLYVVQDRLVLAAAGEGRFLEAAEAAMHFGRGEVHLFSDPDWAPIGHYSRGLHSPRSGRTFRAATPALFSFNSPLGACPTCRGFGRIIEIDYRLAIPDSSLSIDAGAIKCWEGKIYGESKRDLLVFARKQKIPTNVPFASLSPEQRDYVIHGEPGYGEENGKTWPKHWYGIKGFFRYLESKTYKMHVRVFLSRYRAYNPCPDCHGTRLQPEALCWRWRGRTLPELYQLPVDEFLPLLTADGGAAPVSAGARSADLAHESMVTRLRYLQEVGLGYLTLDRPSKTLSGGEVQRVNLTSCLGTSLVDTLFVLDEPSVGLHPRDLGRLIAIIRSLTDAGNTVVVVEHDEAMIRAADHVIELGPAPGSAGGRIVFQGTVAAMQRAPASITGAYLSGRLTIPPAGARRPAPAEWLHFTAATKHNVRQLDFRLPLRRLVCLSGVSGSGKSTLLDNVIYQGLLAQRGRLTDDPAEVASIRTDREFAEIVLADQSPLARTPRSNPAIYSGAWERVRDLYAATPEAQAAGFSASSFSFNSGDGRCDHCLGLGYERVEMQFLSDVFIPCPVCEGRRFKPEVLAIARDGLSVADLLALPIADALPRFAGHPEIHRRLAALEAVGLGYLTLGQPLNTLSGGESQRLKLVKYLAGLDPDAAARGALLLLDEPTTGLHRDDVKRLLGVLQALVDRGHSVVVIEHQLDVLTSADWILEIGPEAGAAGGRIVAEGPPATVAATASATSPYLRAALAPGGVRPVPAGAPPPGPARPPGGRALVITGARENNLKNISLSIPHGAFNVVTGVSGSGKSTLAFDIVFAEGQRRFMESMSPYARQFVEQLPRPALDRLTGIPPTVAIEQRVTRGSRKSTVATITEVAQYLRLLYARLGVQHHPETGRALAAHSPGALKQLLARVLADPRARRARHLYLCAPLIRGRKGHHQPIVTWIAAHGYALMRVDGRVVPVASFEKLDRYREHDLEVVVADLKAGAAGAPAANRALDEALRLGRGSCFLVPPTGGILSWFSTTRTDVETGESFPELDPKHFSFNSPRGWCPRCRGYGRLFDSLRAAGEDEEVPPELADLAADQKSARDDARRPAAPPVAGRRGAGAPVCPDCGGTRLNRIARAVRLPLTGRQPALSLPDLLHRTPGELLAALRRLALDSRGRLITRDILPQIAERVRFLGRVGLGYLPLDRGTDTLSGGEAQRIRLAAQLGSNLSGVLYVLDEPSIGLHARDTERLIATLRTLQAKGNTLLVVEHDEEIMARADRIIDLGPGAGTQGGELLANATPADLRRNPASTTGLFLERGIPHPLRGSYRPLPARAAPPRGRGPAPADPGWVDLAGARLRNLRGFDLHLPAGRLIAVAGPSGAGKSTLCRDLLGPALAYAIARKKARVGGAELARAGLWSADELPADGPPVTELRGAGGFRAVIEVDQAPIGKTPRSTPATYLGLFDLIRQFFAALPESRMRGYTAGRFSFNTAGGRCPTCEGAGRLRLEMAFMPDTYLPCDACGGLRYGPELADIAWKGRNIGEVLQLTFAEAAGFFDFHAHLGPVCRLMVDCGLGYLTLGQSSPTLSGGEAQRLKLVTELARGLASRRDRARGESPRNIYLLEEPTIGLHLSDCEKLIRVLHSLVDQGHTVVVIEHHLDVLAEADYIVELGPRGGPDGGELLYQGPLAGLRKTRGSPTAPYLRAQLRRLRRP